MGGGGGWTTATAPETPALRAPKAAGRATAHRKLATDRPACRPTGATLARESVVDADFIMAIRMSRVMASGAKCSRLASSMGYVTCRVEGLNPKYRVVLEDRGMSSMCFEG